MMLYAILAILALCAVAMLLQRPRRQELIVVVEPVPSSGIGCEPVLLLVAALLVALALAS